MDIQRISKHVGHDGKSYFCWNCGQAGFDSPFHVNGHQSVCPKRQKQVTVNTPPVDTNTPSITNLGGGGGGGGGRGTPPSQEIEKLVSIGQDNPAYTQLYTEVKILRQEIGEVRSDIKVQYAKAFNEEPHLQAVNNYGFLGISREGWLIIGVVAFVAYSLGKDSKCSCNSTVGSSRRSNGNSNSMFGVAKAYALKRGIDEVTKKLLR